MGGLYKIGPPNLEKLSQKNIWFKSSLSKRPPFTRWTYLTIKICRRHSFEGSLTVRFVFLTLGRESSKLLSGYGMHLIWELHWASTFLAFTTYVILQAFRQAFNFDWFWILYFTLSSCWGRKMYHKRYCNLSILQISVIEIQRRSETRICFSHLGKRCWLGE